MSLKLYKDEYWLRQRYVVEHKNIEEIAKLAGVSHMTIYRELQSRGWIRNQRTWKKTPSSPNSKQIK